MIGGAHLARRGAHRHVVLGAVLAALALTGGCRAQVGAGGPHDGCGNDLSGLRSEVWAVDARTGAVSWTTEVPAHGAFLLDQGDGTVRVDTLAAEEDRILDVATGEVVDEVPPTSIRVGIDATGTSLPPGAIVVGDEVHTPFVDVAGLSVGTDGLTKAPEDDLHLLGRSPTLGTVWSVRLASGDGEGGASRPIAVGDDVLVAVRKDQVPTCY